MPSPPEFRDAAGAVGIAEVFRKVKAEDEAETDCHIAVAGKIVIDLQRERGRAQPGIQHRLLLRGAEAGHQLAKQIGKQDLLCQPQHEAPRPGRRVRKHVGTAAQLRRDIGIADDRSGDELREHGDIRCQIDQVPLCRDRPAVHVDGIAQDLEGIEADADRQRERKQRDRQARQRVEIPDHKIGVLEIHQRPQTQQHRQRQIKPGPPLSAAFFDQQAEDIALRDRRQHHEQIPRLAPAVKQQAGEQQHTVFQRSRHQKIDEQNARQKIKQKRNA